MADSIIGVLQATSPDKKLDTTSLTVGANTVERERVQVAGAAATEAHSGPSSDRSQLDHRRSAPWRKRP